MTLDDIIRMAREAGFTGFDSQSERLHDFARLVAAAERNRMIADGWRQCAQGQKTSQFCGMVERARLEEREACAKLCDKYYEATCKFESRRRTHSYIMGKGARSCAHQIRTQAATRRAIVRAPVPKRM
jgi:hypothetical protein